MLNRNIVCIAAAAFGIAIAANCGEETDRPDVVVVPPPLARQDVKNVDSISDILVVFAADPTPFVGKRAALKGMKVQTVAGPRTFWIGPDRNQRLFVVLTDSAAATLNRAVRPNELLHITGAVKRMPADFETVRSRWSLTAANERLLKNEALYLEADSIRPAGKIQ